MYYLQSRYYNPEWGRFINADSRGGKIGELLSHNIFAYCENNPIKYYDPNGTVNLEDLGYSGAIDEEISGDPFEAEGEMTSEVNAIEEEANSKELIHESKVECDSSKRVAGAEAVTSGNISDLPENVQNSYNQYNKSGWKGNAPGQTAGTKAGGAYQNSDRVLSTAGTEGDEITYREFDVNNKLPNSGRDAQRFVVGSDGSIYFTDSHYGDIQSPTGLSIFVKLK